MRRSIPTFLALALGTALAAVATAAPMRTETALFSGGCFWSMESQFEGVPGIRSVVSGYTGGSNAHPNYDNAHLNGHLETIEVTYDPSVIAYTKLLDRFWHGIDPTEDDGQFCDHGETYRTAIWVAGPAQRREAEVSRAALERSHVLHAPIVTRILDAKPFWPAEAYHQDFYRRNPQYYLRYRDGCGRDRRLHALWGAAAIGATTH